MHRCIKFRHLLIVNLLCYFASFGVLAQGEAQEKTVPPSRAAISYSYAPIVKKASPAVVNIYTKSRITVVDNTSPFLNDPFFNQFFAQKGLGFTFGGKPKEQVISSLGSGVIIKPEGIIVTSHHVIKGAQQITVLLSDRRELEAKVMMKDEQYDLAFLKVTTPEPLPYLELRDSDTLEVGDLVLAIGNPFGVGQTVTSGIISGLARKAIGVSDYQFFIQTDAAINPGNSGGALVDMDGKLVGINTAIYSKTGGSVGIGFAIPSNMVRSLVDAKAQGGRVIRPWTGLSVQPVTAEIAESLGMKSPRGVIIRRVYPNSPAEKIGLKPGEIIVSVNGADISNQYDLKYRLALSKIGDTAKLGILHQNDSINKTVELIAPPETPQRDIRHIKGRNPLSGVTVANISPALAAEAGLDDAASGVIVMNVGQSELGLGIGLMPGDIILEINGTKITETGQLEQLLKQKSSVWQIAFMRGTAVQAITVRM